MIVYRIAHKKFADDLSGTGARLKGGRWNPKGLSMLYTSAHISLALIETLVNASSLEDLQMLKLMHIEIPSRTTHSHIIDHKNLKKDWQLDFDYTQWMGQEIIRHKEVLFIQCPSAVVPLEQNYLLNPLHPDFERIRLAEVTDIDFDRRLFKHKANLHLP
jgi:RES domain-containing protein